MADTPAVPATNGAPTFLGVPLDATHVMIAIGGGAAVAALGPAALALPVVAPAVAALEAAGVTIGAGAASAIGGFLAAKHFGG